VQFVLFAVSTAGSVSFSTYILRAATGDPQDGSWLNRGLAALTVTAVCLIHAFAPRPGIWISNALGCFKLVLLVLVVCTGFAALAGRSVQPLPNNFSSFHGPSSVNDHSNSAGEAAGYAVALIQVLYAYSGWENANYVLTEVRDAPRTLKFAAPLAISVITVLYMLANVAYVCSPGPSSLFCIWLIVPSVCGFVEDRPGQLQGGRCRQFLRACLGDQHLRHQGYPSLHLALEPGQRLRSVFRHVPRQARVRKGGHSSFQQVLRQRLANERTQR
jgi:hypothetical protein